MCRVVLTGAKPLDHLAERVLDGDVAREARTHEGVLHGVSRRGEGSAEAAVRLPIGPRCKPRWLAVGRGDQVALRLIRGEQAEELLGEVLVAAGAGHAEARTAKD